jgi:predicted DNA-binding mobile mystery protein A
MDHMKAGYREIRLKQLSSSLAAFEEAKNIARPQRGWLRAVREALGLTLGQVGQAAHTAHQRIVNFEKAEENDRITLRSLRRVAEAMGCELVYAIVPKSGTIQELAEHPVRSAATKRVLAVEHTMALEDQATGNTKQLIDEETKRILKKS